MHEYKTIFADATIQKFDTFRGLIAHTHPNISHADLVDQAFTTAIEVKNPTTKRRSPALTRAIWKKANSQCENCGSTFALEQDHIQAKANGGSDDQENLRLLCRNCNQRAAIEQLGQEKMEKYLRPRHE